MKRSVLVLMVVLALLLLLSISSPVTQVAQIISDPLLLAEINKIKAVDNHAHPKRVVSAGETDDEEDYGPTQLAPIVTGQRASSPLS